MHASVRWGVRCVLRPQHSNRWRYCGLQDDLQRKFNQRAAALEAADAERADEISALKASLARSQAAAEAAQMLAEREGVARLAAEAAAAEMRSQIAEEAALHQRID